VYLNSGCSNFGSVTTQNNINNNKYKPPKMSQPQQPKITFPHLSNNAIAGGIPNVHTDVPISNVFLFLFMCGAAFHMTILQVNNRRNHKFILSGMTFGFCMSRIVTMIMRIVWATHQKNVRVAIASQIFNNAGVILLYIINLIFAGRIFRSVHPRFQSNKIFNTAFKVYIATLVGNLVIVICAVVLSFYTINKSKQKRYDEMRKYGSIYNAVFSCASLALVAATFLFPASRSPIPLGKRGNLQGQVLIVIVAGLLTSFGSIWRATTIFYPRPASHPGWWQDKAMFYITYFTVEILTVAIYALGRVDQRFHIPNKADRIAAREAEKNGGVAGEKTVTDESDLEKNSQVQHDADGVSAQNIRDEQNFD